MCILIMGILYICFPDSLQTLMILRKFLIGLYIQFAHSFKFLEFFELFTIDLPNMFVYKYQQSCQSFMAFE